MADNCDNQLGAKLSGVTSPRTLPTECDMPSVVKYGKDDCISPRPRREQVRENIADSILLMLGAPKIPIELDAQQLGYAVDRALKTFERYADTNMYDYYMFMTTPGQARYTLPCDIGFISGVYYRTDGHCNMQSPNFMEGLSQVPFGRVGSWQGGTFYRPGWGHAGEFVLMQQYHEMYSKLASNIGGYEVIANNDILLYPNPSGICSVVVHYLPRKMDWQETHEWVQDYALALSKQMLGRIRSNISQVVTPGGAVQLDGPTLLQEGLQEKERLEEDLLTKWSGPLGIISW